MSVPVAANRTVKPASGLFSRPAEVASRTEPSFTAEVLPGVEGIDPRHWDELFDKHPDRFSLVRLINATGMDGVTLSTIQVRYGSRLVLIVPVFRARFDISSLIDGAAARAARAVAKVAPSLIHPKLIGIGLVEGEWGAAGVAADLTPAQLDKAWRVAHAELRSLARRSRTRLMVMLDLAQSTLAGIPADLVRGFVPVDTSPCAQVPLPFANHDAYLATLSRSTRQGLRRRMRANSHIRVERTTAPGQHLERMYQLYMATVERSEMKLGVQRRAYFERLCAEVPGAHYVLYHLDDQLLAFNTLIERPDMLVDKYFCMDAQVGRKHSLYFVSWMENVRYAISKGIPLYHAGPGSEDTKSHLGCTFVRSETLFRHTNPVIQRGLSLLVSTIAKRSAAKAKARESSPEPKESEQE